MDPTGTPFHTLLCLSPQSLDISAEENWPCTSLSPIKPTPKAAFDPTVEISCQLYFCHSSGICACLLQSLCAGSSGRPCDDDCLYDQAGYRSWSKPAILGGRFHTRRGRVPDFRSRSEPQASLGLAVRTCVHACRNALLARLATAFSTTQTAAYYRLFCPRTGRCGACPEKPGRQGKAAASRRVRGELVYTPVLSLGGSCTRNCSFPSGESASAIALLAFIILLPEKFRLIGTAILTPFIVIFSLNRVAMGAHFLSDVLIAWPLMFAVFLLVHRPFINNGRAIDATFSRKSDGARRSDETRPFAEQ